MRLKLEKTKHPGSGHATPAMEKGNGNVVCHMVDFVEILGEYNAVFKNFRLRRAAAGLYKPKAAIARRLGGDPCDGQREREKQRGAKGERRRGGERKEEGRRQRRKRAPGEVPCDEQGPPQCEAGVCPRETTPKTEAHGAGSHLAYVKSYEM